MPAVEDRSRLSPIEPAKRSPGSPSGMPCNDRCEKIDAPGPRPDQARMSSPGKRAESRRDAAGSAPGIGEFTENSSCI